jgi:hypothetical protein
MLELGTDWLVLLMVLNELGLGSQSWGATMMCDVNCSNPTTNQISKGKPATSLTSSSKKNP